LFLSNQSSYSDGYFSNGSIFAIVSLLSGGFQVKNYSPYTLPSWIFLGIFDNSCFATRIPEIIGLGFDL
jgi:hypothetical protein